MAVFRCDKIKRRSFYLPTLISASENKMNAFAHGLYRYKYLIEKVNGVSVDVAKDILDKISETEPSIFILFATIESPNKVMFVAKSKNTSFNCGNIVKKCAILCNGNGGGRPDFATAGGRDASKVDISLKEVRELLK